MIFLILWTFQLGNGKVQIFLDLIIIVNVSKRNIILIFFLPWNNYSFWWNIKSIKKIYILNMLFILYYFFSHQYQGRSGFVVQDWNPKFRLTHFRIKSVDSWSSQKSDIELRRWTESHCIKIFYVCRTRNRSSVTIYLKKIAKVCFFRVSFQP